MSPAGAVTTAAAAKTDNTTPTETTKATKSGRKEQPIVAGKEVVGRQVAIWSQKLLDWPKATIAQYKAETRKHLIRFNERAPGSVKHEEEWIDLAKTRFQWLDDPVQDSTPNPSWIEAPRKDDAIGYKVKVFWPGMARWYLGRVESYNPKNQRHTVKYRDGDIQELNLRHEAIVYLNKGSIPPPRSRSRPSGGSASKKRKRIEEGSSGADDKTAVKANRGSGGKKTPGSTKSGKSSKSRNPSAPRESATSSADQRSSASEFSDDDDDDDDEGESGSDMGNGSDGEEMFVEGEMETDSGDDNGFKQQNRAGTSGRKGVHATKKKSGGVPRGGPGVSGMRHKQGGRGGDHHHAGGVPRRRGRPPGSGSSRRLSRDEFSKGQRSSMVRPQKISRVEEEVLKTTGGIVVGARVAVLWSDDGSFYKGKLVQFDSYHKRHKIIYDDGEEEWTALQREHFRCLVPRARSGGCGVEFLEAMQQLGNSSGHELMAIVTDPAAARSLAQYGSKTPSLPPAEQAPSLGSSCVGWIVSVYCDLDQCWYTGEILNYDSERRRVLILYDDGEDEWLDPVSESLTWHRKAPSAGGASEDPGSNKKDPRLNLFPGFQPGTAGAGANTNPPAGQDAVGWRVAVYWPGDAAFYPGEITGYDEAARKHEVSYDDGEEGTVNLAKDKMKWILPPGVAIDYEALERLETGANRPTRKVTAGGDSDPDYEFEQQQQQQQFLAGAGRGGHLSGGHLPMGAPGGGRRGGFGGRGSGGRNGNQFWMYGDGGDMKSPKLHNQRSGSLPLTPNYNPNLAFEHGGSGPINGVGGNAAGAAEGGLAGQPALVRVIRRVPSFATPQGDADGALPEPVTVKIYLSALPAAVDEKSAEEKKEVGVLLAGGMAQQDMNATPGDAAGKKEVTPVAPSPFDEAGQPKPGFAPTTTPTPAPAAAAAPDATAGLRAATTTPVTPATDPLAVGATFGSGTLPSQPSSLQANATGIALAPPATAANAEDKARLEALAKMARRVARAQQTINRGVPTNMPSYVAPPAVTQIVNLHHGSNNHRQRQPVYPLAAGAHGSGSALPGSAGVEGNGVGGSGGPHRLARPPVTSHSPFQRSRPRVHHASETHNHKYARFFAGGDEDDEEEDGRGAGQEPGQEVGLQEGEEERGNPGDVGQRRERDVDSSSGSSELDEDEEEDDGDDDDNQQGTANNNGSGTDGNVRDMLGGGGNDDREDDELGEDAVVSPRSLALKGAKIKPGSTPPPLGDSPGVNADALAKPTGAGDAFGGDHLVPFPPGGSSADLLALSRNPSDLDIGDGGGGGDDDLMDVDR